MAREVPWCLFSYKYLVVCLAESLKVSLQRGLRGVCCPDCKPLRLFKKKQKKNRSDLKKSTMAEQDTAQRKAGNN